MLEFSNVSKSFWTGKTRKVILDRASFKVEKGNSLGILAPNGTGKTTIINMMAGLEKPHEGEIIRTSRISFPLGFMGGVTNKHTGTENARYIARLYGLDPDYMESFCRWLAGINEYFDMPVGTYSSGMRSRFSFALGGGIKTDLSDSFALKLQGRWTPTYINSSPGGVWCDPFFCYQTVNNQYAGQWDVTGSLVLKF